MHTIAENYISRQHIKNALEARRRHILWVLSLFVVLSVFWVLKLTGITMAGEAFCGIEEHAHGIECGQYLLICEKEEQEPHSHSESCIAPQLICTMEETEGHSHADTCFEKTLICTETEQPAHTHGDGCYGTVYTCGKEESEPHTHSESCRETVMVCTLAETEAHSHTEECIQQTLICTDKSAEHSHTEGCYEEKTICGKEESAGHSHTESCSETKLVCTLPEGEGHTHSAQCGSEQLICTLTETTGHTHTDVCYTANLICTAEETEGHTHSESCYTAGIGFGCGLLEAGGHTHTAECITAETQLGCGKEITEGHTHGEECMQFTGACLIEEHIHDESCYSNINADLETSADWEATIGGVVIGARPSENLVAVAQSQLGYTESQQNFELDENGNRNGYTRYGQWYGNPYGQWNTMFVSFCLHYSQLQGIPMSSGAETMRIEWDSTGLYIPAEAMQPAGGELLFLDKNGNGAADAVAIVTAYSDGQITVIEGDLENKVAETTYSLEDGVVMGYGVIPDMSGIMTLAETDTIAQTVTYSTSLFDGTRHFVLYTQSGNNYYAIDGNANAVQIFIDAQGNITSNVADPNTLLWTFEYCGTYDNRNTYYIQNVATGRYMHPYRDSNTNHGATLTGRWESAIYPVSTGFKIRGARQNAYAYLQNNTTFTDTSTYNAGSTFYLGRTAARCTVWLDGTQGGLEHLTGSPNTPYSVAEGGTIQLPTTWTSSDKYAYKLRGWYDITNGRYYRPGDTLTVTGNTVLYADWVAATYDIGIFNAQVADTVSTNSFITTHMFDYNYLLNIHSSRAEITANASGHSETWSMVTSGNVLHGNKPTLDFIFVDNDSGGRLCIPNNRSSHNVYPGAGVVTPGIYSDTIGELLFSTENIYNPDTGEGIIGKTYLGTGDHLFQIMTDPSDEHYGYYYYDSKRNAASYNQSNNRFYVYEYLSGTSDAIGSTNSDFLPLNSPYANTNGQTVGTYTYNGVDGEYEGVTHYRYDSKYNSGNYNSADAVQTDYAYGMRSDVRFYLPNEPGSGGNKDLIGQDMQFKFSGDDDLWVLIDGKLVLDIGGIHGAESGTIDFSTGEVTVQGKAQDSLIDLGITAGDHTMSILYLERGSSLSNCSIYFNLAPRFALQIKKEDVLSQNLLNGAQFTVYEDLACTQPAELWESEAAYFADLEDGVLNSSQSTFTVTNGTAKIWGMGSGNTYYIKETKAPDKEGYTLAQGIIRLTIERDGLATYNVDIISDANGNGPSNGYTVHGVTIDEATQTAYITVTNAQNWVQEITSVEAVKIWEDDIDHSGDYVTVYLTVTDDDGTVRRIREMILSAENNWTYTWTNLPKKDEDGNEIQYGVSESYEEGYYSTSTKVDKIVIDSTTWAEAVEFLNGDNYLLKSSNGCLATTSDTANTFVWMEEEAAKESPLALWTAMVSDGKVKFTNGAGQTINLNTSSNNYYYNAVKTGGSYQGFTPVQTNSGIRLYINTSRWSNYYIGSRNSNTSMMSATTTSSRATVFTPMKQVRSYEEIDIEDWGFKIVNTPLKEETSLSVTKVWSIPSGDATMYQENQVTVKLLANGVDTGRTVTLTLKNNWTETFRGLPYKDSNGDVITYTVEESWRSERWKASYGPIVSSGGSIPTYSTTVTNTYVPPGGPMLPSTGSFARLAYVYCGFGIMLTSLAIGIRQRRKMERRKQ